MSDNQNQKSIYAISALFSTPNSILEAAKKVAERGYKNWDVHTPYPVHGMDDAMNLKPSKLPWVSLGLQLFATSFSIFFMWMIMAVVYPLIIGGKPMFSLTNFSPVIVAFSILCTVVGTVVVLFLFFCKLPRNNHAISDTAYAKATCCDQYGIIIEADNEGFDAEEVKSFLASLGGQVGEIYPANEEEKFEIGFFKPKKFSTLFVVSLLAIIGATAVGTYGTFNLVLYDRVPLIHTELMGYQFVKYRDTVSENGSLEWRLAPLSSKDSASGIIYKVNSPYTWMDVQSRENPQSQSHFFKDGKVMRTHVAGTVPRGYKPYEFSADAAGAATLKNPLPYTAENLKRGQTQYNIYCVNCHGNFADGDGNLAGKLPSPPSLHTQKSLNATDGSYYHILAEGQNSAMPAFDKQISRDDRWRIVQYIRALQRAKNAKDSDLK
jgi:mono/diheme cytochrome c family protein